MKQVMITVDDEVDIFEALMEVFLAIRRGYRHGQLVYDYGEGIWSYDVPEAGHESAQPY